MRDFFWNRRSGPASWTRIAAAERLSAAGGDAATERAIDRSANEKRRRILSAADLKIDPVTYDRAARAVTALRRYLGIDVKLFCEGEGAERRLAEGEIFVFNHFARFETVVPGYLIYEALGAHTRTLAHHALFEGPPALAELLIAIGAAPTRMEGVLAFLAAEILKGRKVVIFPEGGMIKDRRVTDAHGALGVRSPSAETVRKHHTGASALAIMLEIFKERVRSVAARGESERLARWTAALEIDDAETLLARARAPTTVVPGAITFHPIRGEPSFATRALEAIARRLVGGLSAHYREELVIEGNIIFQPTDMDVRLAPPQRPAIAWSLFERQLLGRAFAKVDDLNDLFDAATRPNGVLENLAARMTRAIIDDLRDRCMEAIYAHVTISVSHIASRLLLDLWNRGEREIDEAEFAKRIYLALKRAQAAPGVFLHRGAENPASYRALARGAACEDWTRLRDRAIATGLLEARDGRLFLKEALDETVDVEHPRLDRIVQVYANELAPARAAVEAITAAAVEPPPDDAALAEFAFDDEMRAYRRAKRLDADFPEVAERERGRGDGAPFWFRPEPARALGVLLVHGFLSSPNEMRAFGERLAARGHPVLGARLDGHGASPFDLRAKSWTDWYDSLIRCYEILAARCEAVAIVGFSSGAVLALRLAAEQPERLAGVAAIAPISKTRSRALAPSALSQAVTRLSQWRWELEGEWPFQPIDPDHPEISYRSVPVRALFEIERALDDAHRRLGSVRCPVRLLHASRDHVVDPESSAIIERELTAAPSELIWIDSERHELILERVGPTWELITDFLDRLEAPAERRILG